MLVHKVDMSDYSAVLSLFTAVKKELTKQGNDQWKWIYPNRFTHKKDIAEGSMYGVKEGNGFAGVITWDDKQHEKYANLAWKDSSGKVSCIHRLAVHPEQQGRGLGKKLLLYAEGQAKSAGCTSVRIEVYSANAGALALYEKYGYERVGEVSYPMRKHAYIAMEKHL